MKKLSLAALSETVVSRRKALKLSQAELAQRTGMHRSVLSKLESEEYIPSIPQLEALAEALGFDPTDLYAEEGAPQNKLSLPAVWRWRALAMWAFLWPCC